MARSLQLAICYPVKPATVGLLRRPFRAGAHDVGIEALTLRERSMRHGIVFQGRLDTQVKIRGNRLELEEVEHVVEACSHAALCADHPHGRSTKSAVLSASPPS